MRRLLLLADAVLVAVAAWLAVGLHSAVTRPPPGPQAVAPLAAPTPPAPDLGRAPGEVLEPARPALTAYALVAERNLFSPNRSEATPEPPRPAPTTAPVPVVKPRLHGVVILPDGKDRAWLEDVRSRKVFAYSTGDTIADSRIERIQSDRVVFRRGGETYEVMLRDPSKPRPPAGSASAGRPAAVIPPPAGGVPAGPEIGVRRRPGLPGAPGVAPGAPARPPVFRPGRPPSPPPPEEPPPDPDEDEPS